MLYHLRIQRTLRTSLEFFDVLRIEVTGQSRIFDALWIEVSRLRTLLEIFRWSMYRGYEVANFTRDLTMFYGLRLRGIREFSMHYGLRLQGWEFHSMCRGWRLRFFVFAWVFEPQRDKNQQNDLCAQRILRSAWASAPWIACGQRRLWSDWTDSQADLSLRWAHRPYFWFCYAAAHFGYLCDCGASQVIWKLKISLCTCKLS